MSLSGEGEGEASGLPIECDWDFDFEDSDADLDVASDVKKLGVVARVVTANSEHPLLMATPWAGWKLIPGAGADDPPLGFWVD